MTFYIIVLADIPRAYTTSRYAYEEFMNSNNIYYDYYSDIFEGSFSEFQAYLKEIYRITLDEYDELHIITIENRIDNNTRNMIASRGLIEMFIYDSELQYNSTVKLLKALIVLVRVSHVFRDDKIRPVIIFILLKYGRKLYDLITSPYIDMGEIEDIMDIAYLLTINEGGGLISVK